MALSQQDFVSTYGPLADDVSQATGLDRNVVLGVMAQETGWGNHFVGGNVFGISPGGKVASYGSVPQGAQAFVDLIKQRYSGVTDFKPEDQPQALVMAGYNTADKGYAGKVADNARQIAAMTKGDSGGPSTDDLMGQIRGLRGQQPNAGTQKAAEPSADDLMGQIRQIVPQAPVEPAKPSTWEDRMIPQPPPPQGAFGPPPPPPPSTTTSALDYLKQGALGVANEINAGMQGVLTPEYEAKLAAVPYVGGALHEGSALLGGALAVPSALFHALQGGVATGADAIIPPNAGGRIGPSLAAGLELVPALQAFGGLAAGNPLNVRQGVPYAIQRGSDIIADQSVPLGSEFRGSPFAPGTAQRVIAGPVPGPTEPTGVAPSAVIGSPQPRQRLSVGSDPPGPTSAGAAATPSDAIPEASRAEALRNLEREVNQSAEDRAGPQMVDNTAYVQGIPTRPLASRVFNSQNALDEKILRAKPELGGRDVLDKIETDRNQGMVDLLRKDAGDAGTLAEAIQERQKVAPDQFGAFDGEAAVPDKAAALLQTVDDALDSPSAKRGAVRSALQDVRDSLVDKDGNVETLPSRIYGARQNLTDLLDRSKGTGDEAKKLQAATAILGDLLPQFDDTIGAGAPKYDDYRAAYQQASQAVNQQHFLQKYTEGTSGNKITDISGTLQLSRVQKLLNDIYQEQKRSGVSEAKSLTDDQIQNIINVRNELAAAQLRDKRGAVRGSDTFQQINREAEQGSGVLGTALRAGASLGGQALVSHLAGIDPTINALALTARAVGRPTIEAARLRRLEAQRQAKTAARTQELLTQGPTNPLSLYP